MVSDVNFNWLYFRNLELTWLLSVITQLLLIGSIFHWVALHYTEVHGSHKAELVEQKRRCLIQK